MAEVLARVAIVLIAITVRVPLLRILGVRVMGLMKRIVLHGLGSAFQAGCQQGDHEQMWNPRFHAISVQELFSKVQIQFTQLGPAQKIRGSSFDSETT
jgi:hypothetical protein